jgi:hypothetical protein
MNVRIWKDALPGHMEDKFFVHKEGNRSPNFIIFMIINCSYTVFHSIISSANIYWIHIVISHCALLCNRVAKMNGKLIQFYKCKPSMGSDMVKIGKV